MKPIRYTKHGDVTRFHYDRKELRKWKRQGYLTGDVGAILFERVFGSWSKYKAFGTIENPARHITIWTIMHLPMMDGPQKTDDEIVAPYKEPAKDPRRLEYTAIVLDCSLILK